MVKCQQCGLLFVNPRPALSEIDEAARTGMHRFGDKALNVIGAFSRRKVRFYVQRLKDVVPAETWRDPNLSWVDIGAGYGEMTGAVKEMAAKGARVQGIEPCEPKVRVAQKLGLPVDTTPLSQVTDRFTHVSLINVFSHLPDPVEFLRQLAELLVPSGKLLLVTGNAADISRDEYPGNLYLPDHLIFGGEESIKAVLEKAGFEVIVARTYADMTTMDGPLVTTMKNGIRRIMGKPVLPLRLPKGSRFRSLWIYAIRA